MESTTTKGSSDSMKKAYADKFDAQLKSLAADLDKLKAKAQGASADLRIQINKQIEDFQAKQQAAQSMFEEYKAAGADRVEAIKGGLEKAWNDLKRSMEQSQKS